MLENVTRIASHALEIVKRSTEKELKLPPLKLNRPKYKDSAPNTKRLEQQFLLPLRNSKQDEANKNRLTNHHRPDSRTYVATKAEQQLAKMLKDSSAQIIRTEANDHEDTFDFEAKINANKDIIKERRRQRLLKAQPYSQENFEISLKLTHQKQHRNLSTYEHLQTEPQKDQRDALKPKRADYVNRTIDIKPRDLKNKEEKTPKPKLNRALENQFGSISQPRKASQNVFDCIQTYLENPKYQLKTEEKPTVITAMPMELLLRKLQIVDEQLGSSQGSSISKEIKDRRKIMSELVSPASANDRVNFLAEDPDLRWVDRQLDKLGSLQERNSACLSSMLANQRQLLDSKLVRQERH